jgi:hypothetical protein
VAAPGRPGPACCYVDHTRLRADATDQVARSWGFVLSSGSRTRRRPRRRRRRSGPEAGPVRVDVAGLAHHRRPRGRAGRGRHGASPPGWAWQPARQTIAPTAMARSPRLTGRSRRSPGRSWPLAPGSGPWRSRRSRPSPGRWPQSSPRTAIPPKLTLVSAHPWASSTDPKVRTPASTPSIRSSASPGPGMTRPR